MTFKREDGTIAFTQEEYEAAVAAREAEWQAKLEKNSEKSSNTAEELKEIKAALKKREKEDAERQAAVEKAEQERLKALADAERSKEEAELDAKKLVERRTIEFQKQIDELAAAGAREKQERENDRALFAREREYQEVLNYRETAIRAAADDIEPRFFDYIQGTTKEEVDASVAQAVQKTAEMFAEISQAQTTARSQMPGVRPGPPAIGQLDAPQGDQELTPEQIKAMPFSEFAKFRQGRIPQSGTGIFG